MKTSNFSYFLPESITEDTNGYKDTWCGYKITGLNSSWVLHRDNALAHDDLSVKVFLTKHKITIRNLGKITGQISRPQFHLSLLGSLTLLRTYRHLAAKVGTSKGGGKQWQTTPKNLPRMQCVRATSVT